MSLFKNIYFYIEEMNWKLILNFSLYVDLYIKMSILICYTESLQLKCSKKFCICEYSCGNMIFAVLNAIIVLAYRAAASNTE